MTAVPRSLEGLAYTLRGQKTNLEHLIKEHRAYIARREKGNYRRRLAEESLRDFEASLKQVSSQLHDISK